VRDTWNLTRRSSSGTFPFNFNADMTLREFDAGARPQEAVEWA